MNRGDDFRRFEVVDVLSEMQCAPGSLENSHLPPTKVGDGGDGQLVCLVDEDVLIESPLIPFKVVDGHYFSVKTSTVLIASIKDSSGCTM